jgi:hypothetical protein
MAALLTANAIIDVQYRLLLCFAFVALVVLFTVVFSFMFSSFSFYFVSKLIIIKITNTFFENL